MKQAPAGISLLFEPRSVAVIGASPNTAKIGYKVVANMVVSGYRGKIYPVNPQGGEIHGLPAFRSLEEIPGEVDVAAIVIPAKLVFDAVRQCAAKRVKFLMIITSGFAEVGNVDEERQIVAYAREHGMRVLGPNIFGLYSAQVALNATFGPKDITPGNVAILTQSGALGIAMIGMTAVERIGLSAMVSIGNKADLDEADLLTYLVHHAATKVVLMYIEGVQDGQRLITALKEATRIKPVVVIKSGRSKRGAMAAASHTGSLAGADEIFDAIARQCGVIRAESIQEAFDWAKFLSAAPLPTGNNTVIITNGGGVGVMATDACEKYNVKLYDDPQLLKEIFSAVTPDFGSTKNPIDLTGGAGPANYRAALETALVNPNIQAIIALYCETALFDLGELSAMIEDTYSIFNAAGKPIIFSLLGGEKIDACLRALRHKGIPVFGDVYTSVSCLGVLYRYARQRLIPQELPPAVKIDAAAIEAIVAGANAEGRTFLLAHEGQALMRAAGITVPRSAIARSMKEAVQAAEAIGFPLVMKIVSRDILHKSDAGGVALDLDTTEEILDAYQAIMHSCRAYDPKAKLDGVEVTEMVTRSTETIIGARIDRSFGPVVMFGLGGIYVEVMKDVAFRAAPLARREVADMLKEIKSYPLLLGVRGEKMKDIDGVVDTILKLGAIIQNCPGITDIEINPLVVYEQGDGVKAVDVRVLLSKAERR